MLDEGVGEQFFARPLTLDSKEITTFNDLLGLGIDALYDYQDDENGGICITKYLGDDISILEIPSLINGKPVTGIGERVFEYNSFASVILPETLTHIDKEAFRSCYYLTSITFPASLTSIGEYAFSGCDLQEVYIPDNVTDIGAGAFYYCTNLRSVRLPSGLQKVPASAFSGCAISSIDVPDTVTEIGKSAYYDCDSLRSVYLPENISIIGDSAFNGCDALTDITCAGEIELLDHAALGDCGWLTSVTFQKGVKVVGDYAFSSCPALQTIDLYGAESLGESAFRWDTGLTNVILPDTLTEFGAKPFGDYTHTGATYEVPENLRLTVITNSYAESWAKENGIPYVSVAPPTEEELLAKRYPILTIGSTGENVRLLQQTLIDSGYLNDIADGSYGPNTAKAVATAQETFGMEADGIASSSFQAKLYGE